MKTPEQQRFTDNYKLIYYVLNKYFPTHQSDEDITQEGAIGLWKACRNYDASRGAAFSAYAVMCIKSEIRHVFTCANYPKRTRYKTNYFEDMAMPDSTPYDFITYQTPGQLTETEEVDLKIDIERFVKSLYPKERVVVNLLGKGYTQREISRLAGTSEEAISCRLRRIRKKAVISGLPVQNNRRYNDKRILHNAKINDVRNRTEGGVT